MMTMVSSATAVETVPDPIVLGAAEPAHGALVWPAWGIALLGVLCVLIGFTYFAARLYRARVRRNLS
jgi:hypothetical protein